MVPVVPFQNETWTQVMMSYVVAKLFLELQIGTVVPVVTRS